VVISYGQRWLHFTTPRHVRILEGLNPQRGLVEPRKGVCCGLLRRPRPTKKAPVGGTGANQGRNYSFPWTGGHARSLRGSWPWSMPGATELKLRLWWWRFWIKWQRGGFGQWRLGRCAMPKPDEYRTMADECLRSAREAQTKEERLLYLNFARVWLEFASRQDAEASPPRLPPAPHLKGSSAD
jgi:hypothetical protein